MNGQIKILNKFEKKLNMKPNPIKDRTFEFALKIFAFCRQLSEKKEFIISKQLLKSGTSVGANVREAEHAESRPDFKHKISIALKEINETNYWIDILIKSGFEKGQNILHLKNEASQILSILVAILKKTKEK